MTSSAGKTIGLRKKFSVGINQLPACRSGLPGTGGRRVDAAVLPIGREKMSLKVPDEGPTTVVWAAGGMDFDCSDSNRTLPSPSEELMNPYMMRKCERTVFITGTIVVLMLLALAGESLGHGGKTHADEPFSAFEAVQKAVTLYDRLIVTGKLPESWETALSSIHVDVRGKGSERETVIQFKRTAGDPDSVFFYFNHQGDYAGSNFTGK